MTTIDRHFTKLIESTLPGDSARAAQEAAPEVREHLRKHVDLPTLESPTTLLIGSYKRSTAVQDLKDVDILVFIDAEERDYAPSEVLDLLRKTLDDFPSSESSTRKQKRSVRIRLTDRDVDLDLVPALGYSSDNSQPLRVPDAEAACWIDSHPLRYEELLTALNQQHDCRVKPLIRLFKVWRNEHFVYKRPKSYWLEVLAYQAIRDGFVRPKEDGYPQAFRDLLAYAADNLGAWTDIGMAPTIADPVLGVSITGDWPIDHWRSWVGQSRADLEIADRALAEAEADVAAVHWARVFGDAWVEDATVESALHKSILAGTAAVSSGGAVLQTKPIVGTAYSVPPARAYGGAGDESHRVW